MRRPNFIFAALVAGMLALLMIAYLFAGRDGRDRLHDGADQAGPEARCASPETYDLIKRELFRQAADLRGEDAGTFRNVASKSVLRMTSPTLTRHDAFVGITGCAGSLTLDLPPGMAVAGGRRSLAGDVGYAVQTSGGSNRSVTLSAAAIVTPLATLFRAGMRPNQQIARAEPDLSARTRALPAVERRPPQEVGLARSLPSLRAPARQLESPLPSPRSAIPRPDRAEKQRDRPRATATTVPTPAAPERHEADIGLSPPASETAEREPAPAAQPPPRPSATPPTGPIAAAPAPIVSPSFNCRFARTRGEVAVCGDGRLASLDRQMAGDFRRAMSVADTGKRVQLQRSRLRFLRYRDSCRSKACVAAAYADRLRQIDDIMNERFSPP